MNLTPQTPPHPSGDKRFKLLDVAIKRHQFRQDALIEILHTAQELFGYLDNDVLIYVGRAVRAPLSRVYGVATFYNFFSMKPPGEHPCVVCMGTACYVKGAGQILYGPSTVGGVINYLTPQPPPRASGSVTLLGGSRDYLNAHARFGATIRNTGLLFDAMRKQGEGARDSVRSGLDDYTVKVLSTLTPRQPASTRACRTRSTATSGAGASRT